MSNNPEKDAARALVRKQEIIRAAYRAFTESTIEKVTMNDVAEAAGIGVATVYRHFLSKPALVLAVSTTVWREYMETSFLQAPGSDSRTAARIFEHMLDAFIDMYRNHRDLLRFNQMFNIYVRSEDIPSEQLQPYGAMIHVLVSRFHAIYELGKKDGTLRTDIPENEIFSAVLHLMLAAAARYAMGLLYNNGIDPEQELLLLKKMLMQEYVLS